MPKPSTQTIIDAITKGIEQGADRGKLLASIGKKWQLSQRTFDRYWKTANEQHTAKQQGIKSKLAIIDEQAAIEARKKAIMSAEERKEWLTKVVNGEIEVILKKPFWNPKLQVMQFVPVSNPADITERLRASAELSKMEGDYAPTKVASTDVAGNDVAATLTDEQVDRILDKIR